MTTEIKTTLLTVFFLFGMLTGLQAQSLKIDSLTKKYIMREVISCDTTLKREQLYVVCKDWVVRNLKSSDNNIQLDDKDYKQITATGNLKTNIPVVLCELEGCRIEFKLTLNVKDGKIRYTIENIVHYAPGLTSQLESWNLKKELGRKAFAEVEKQLKSLVDNLKNSVTNPQNKDDW